MIEISDLQDKVSIQSQFCNVIAIHICEKKDISRKMMESIGNFKCVIYLMSSEYCKKWYRTRQHLIFMCTVFFFISQSIFSYDIRNIINENKLFLCLVVNIWHSKVTLFCSSFLVLHIVAEFPRETLEQSLKFRIHYFIFFAKSYHQLHMMPVSN